MLFCNRIDVVKEDGIDMFGNIRLILSYPYRSHYKIIKNHSVAAVVSYGI